MAPWVLLGLFGEAQGLWESQNQHMRDALMKGIRTIKNSEVQSIQSIQRNALTSVFCVNF
jgi:hypothetical protein